MSGAEFHGAGDIYGAVPMIIPVAVSLSSVPFPADFPRSLATPKSSTLTNSGLAMRETMKTLSGCMSGAAHPIADCIFVMSDLSSPSEPESDWEEFTALQGQYLAFIHLESAACS